MRGHRREPFSALGILDGAVAGELVAGPPFPSLLRFFDRELLRLAKRHGAVEHRYPSVILSRQLRKLGFFEAFPKYATWVTNAPGSADGEVLTPSVCYHLYDLLEGQRLTKAPLIVTSCGVCFRAEGARHAARDGRLQSFSMREIVVIGSDGDVRSRLGRIATAAPKVLARAGLSIEVQAASDSFFLGKARGRHLLQKIAGLKSELTFHRPGRSPLALGSINIHRDFFGKRMKITLPEGATAESGCVAFGIERLALAFMEQHGLDRRRWPLHVARFVDGDAAC